MRTSRRDGGNFTLSLLSKVYDDFLARVSGAKRGWATLADFSPSSLTSHNAAVLPYAWQLRVLTARQQHARPARHAVAPSAPVNASSTQSMDGPAVPCFCPHSARRLLCWLPFLPTHSPSHRKLNRLTWMAGLLTAARRPPDLTGLRMMRCCRGPARAASPGTINLLTHIAYPTGPALPPTHQTRAGSIEQR